MQPVGHFNFISTPISTIIEETNRACMALGKGIEIHPLASYIMQTTFLRMTGASEQKLKCICWEIATFDYEFRYKLLQKPLGECSSFDDKKNIFKNICESLKKFDIILDFSDDEKDRIIETSTKNLISTIHTSPLAVIFEREFKEFISYCSTKPIKRTFFCNMNKEGSLSLLENELKTYYVDYVYCYRNRYAHNLTSYQLNIPTFTQLAKLESEKNNHFRMLSLLTLMDGIFMTLFNRFQTIRNAHSY